MSRSENVISGRNGVRKQRYSFYLNLIPYEWQGKNTYHVESTTKIQV